MLHRDEILGAIGGVILITCTAACVTIGDGPTDDGGPSGPDGPGVTDGSTTLFGHDTGGAVGDSSVCFDVCEKIDGCGILSEYDVSLSACTDECVATASAQELEFALKASCDDLEDALLEDSGGAGSSSSGGGGTVVDATCLDLCDKALGCGIIDVSAMIQCIDWCDQQLDSTELAYAMELSCSELATASAGLGL